MTALYPDLIVKECREYEYVELDPSLWLGETHQAIFNSEIDGKDVLRASFNNGRIRLQATSYVGVIPINDKVILRVKPRVPLGDLTRMVVDTGHGVMALSALRGYTGHGTADDWVMDRYAAALLDHVDEALDQGLLREYRRYEDEGRFPHGRLELSSTMQRFSARGVPNKAVFTWHERSIDTPANRCVKAALEIVFGHLTKPRPQVRKGDRRDLSRLAAQLQALEEVSDDPDLRFLDDPRVLGLAPLPDPRTYYRPALDVSVLILRGVGIALDIGGDDVRLGSLLVNTNELFETFVRVSLAKHAKRQRWPVDVLDGNTEGKVDLYHVPEELPSPFGLPLEAAARRDAGKAQPDVVLRSPDGQVPLIAEVKNTLTSDKALPDRSHVEQAVTYALRYGLDFALLIHPWSNGKKGLVYVGRVRTIDVYDYRLDLSSEEHVDAALSDMAAVVERLAGLSDVQAPMSG